MNPVRDANAVNKMIAELGDTTLQIGHKVHEELLATEQASKLKPFPVVGQTLVIMHEIKRDSRNEAILGFRRRAKPIYTRIIAVYLDGSVRDNHSDVWEVKPGTLGQWETVNPEREAAIRDGKI